MELQLVLERLNATIEKMKGLKPEQFRYESFISEFDDLNNCGTVCCVAGHYPNWFKEAGFEYFYDDIKLKYFVVRRVNGNVIDANISDLLVVYHGLDYNIIDALFYGYPLYSKGSGVKLVENSVLSKLPKVISVFEKVYKLLETGRITPNGEKVTNSESLI